MIVSDEPPRPASIGRLRSEAAAALMPSRLPQVGYLARRLLRWVAVGGVFEVMGIALLYVLHGMWLIPLLGATLLVAELTTLPRFFVNDRFVFGHRRPSWPRLWQYHAACGGGFGVWYAVANVLPLLGVHYVIASLCATACSVGLAVASNFGWVWRSKSSRRTAAGSHVGLPPH